MSTVHGVWNLSSDQGSLGTFIVTNVRFVWFADVNEGFNISLPYLQIETVRVFKLSILFLIFCGFQLAIRDSKFGTALVITSSEASGLYVLGFKVDPEEKLRILFKELSSLHTVYASKPIFGVEYRWSSNQEQQESSNFVEEFEDDKKNEISNSIAAYLADEGHSKDRLPVFCPELGLAVESIKEGYSLQKLWEVIPS